MSLLGRAVNKDGSPGSSHGSRRPGRTHRRGDKIPRRALPAHEYYWALTCPGRNVLILLIPPEEMDAFAGEDDLYI